MRATAGRCWLAVVAACLCFGVAPAQALVVTVDLGWGYPSGHTLSEYNLQEGSIVQVVMYNSATASPPGTATDDNFDIYSDMGTNTIPAQPSTNTTPTDTTIYFPETTPAGHVIAYTTQIGPAVDGWWNIYAQFEILGTYDSLYIRVFGATDFPEGEAVSTYWGLSGVQTGTNIIDTWYVPYIDNTSATNLAYFEVIPEPGSLALFMTGGAGLWIAHRRRQKKHLREG